MPGSRSTLQAGLHTDPSKQTLCTGAASWMWTTRDRSGGDTVASLTDEHAKYSGVLFAPNQSTKMAGLLPRSARRIVYVTHLCRTLWHSPGQLAQSAPCLQTFVVVCFGPILCTMAVWRYWWISIAASGNMLSSLISNFCLPPLHLNLDRKIPKKLHFWCLILKNDEGNVAD